MKKDFKNFIEDIKSIKLSESDRDLLRSHISEFISFNPIRGEVKIPREKSYISIFEVRHFAKATALLLIFAVVVGGSGVSYAASNSLPGDKLYSVKVNVNEEIEDRLALSNEAKMAVQSKKVERRLEEAQILVKEKKLSANNKKIVEDKLEEHINELSKQIEVLKGEGQVETVLETTANLTPVLEAHKEIFEKKNVNDDTSTLVAKVEDSIQKVEAEEDGAIAIAIDSATPGGADTTATFSTMMAVEIPTEEERAAKEAREEAKDQIEDIGEKIEDIVQSRIRSAKEKISEIKKEETALKAQADAELKAKEEAESPSPANPEATTENKLDVKTPVTNIKTMPVTDVKVDATIETTTSSSTEIENTEEITKDEFDIFAKIKEAESLIREAEDMLYKGRPKEALNLAQQVNKIAAEIETYRHIKSLDITQKDTSAEQKASVVETSK